MMKTASRPGPCCLSKLAGGDTIANLVLLAQNACVLYIACLPGRCHLNHRAQYQSLSS